MSPSIPAASVRREIILSGICGVLAALLVGIGEYLLHFDELARFSAGGYDFMKGIASDRTTAGHFVGVLGATMYPVGCWHIYQMLTPANRTWAFRAFLIGAFGFIIGAVWIGSRASISAIVQMSNAEYFEPLVDLYILRYETLLQIIRITTLALSVIFIWLTIGGRSYYPKWMAVFNPITLILGSFLLFYLAPSIGKHVMPIALNVAFFIFFSLSVCCALRINRGPD